MKTRIFALLALMVCVFPLSSFRSANQFKHLKVATAKQTTTEFGEFTYGNTVYGVYGDASTNTITEVDYFWSGVPVYSFSGTYTPPHGTVPAYVNLTVYTSAMSSFHYSGQLLFY